MLAAGLLAAAPVAHAYEAGDFMLRLGPVHVAPDDSSSDLNLQLVRAYVEPLVRIQLRSGLLGALV